MGLLVELYLKGKKVLLIGGGHTATRKFLKLYQAQPSLLRVIGRKITDEIKKLAFVTPWVELFERDFQEEDLDGFHLVLAATNDADLNRKISFLAKEKGIWVNVVSDKELSDFYFLATVEKPPFSIGISSSGMLPAFSGAFREVLESIFPLDELVRELRLLAFERGKISPPEMRKKCLNRIFTILTQLKSKFGYCIFEEQGK